MFSVHVLRTLMLSWAFSAFLHHVNNINWREGVGGLFSREADRNEVGPF